MWLIRRSLFRIHTSYFASISISSTYILTTLLSGLKLQVQIQILIRKEYWYDMCILTLTHYSSIQLNTAFSVIEAYWKTHNESESKPLTWHHGLLGTDRSCQSVMGIQPQTQMCLTSQFRWAGSNIHRALNVFHNLHHKSCLILSNDPLSDPLTVWMHLISVSLFSLFWLRLWLRRYTVEGTLWMNGQFFHLSENPQWKLVADSVD